MSSTFDKIFPQRLLEVRKRLGLTQRQLASQAGIRQPRLSKFESGDATPSVAELKELARVLGVDVVDLMGVGGASADPDATKRRLGQIVDGLSPSDREMLIQIAEVILERAKRR